MFYLVFVVLVRFQIEFHLPMDLNPIEYERLIRINKPIVKRFESFVFVMNMSLLLVVLVISLIDSNVYKHRFPVENHRGMAFVDNFSLANLLVNADVTIEFHLRTMFLLPREKKQKVLHCRHSLKRNISCVEILHLLVALSFPLHIFQFVNAMQQQCTRGRRETIIVCFSLSKLTKSHFVSTLNLIIEINNRLV